MPAHRSRPHWARLKTIGLRRSSTRVFSISRRPSARRGYLFKSAAPLYPFGFGLSYTTFAISQPRLSSDRISVGEAVTVSVDVRNTGARAGDEVVQVYVRDLIASVTRPVRELKGFKRVTLAPGESTHVSFVLEAEAFSFWN